MTETLTSEHIQKLMNGEKVVLSTSLESTENNPISIECYMIPTESSRKWVLVTAVANNIAIGFVDGIFYGDQGTSKIEAPHVMRVTDPKFEHTPIRFEAVDDGLFVQEGERGRKVGSSLVSVIRSAFSGLGAKALFVNQVKKDADGFYKKLGMKPVLGGFKEELSK